MGCHRPWTKKCIKKFIPLDAKNLDIVTSDTGDFESFSCQLVLGKSKVLSHVRLNRIFTNINYAHARYFLNISVLKKPGDGKMKGGIK